MKNKTLWGAVLHVILFIAVFVLLQSVSQLAVRLFLSAFGGAAANDGGGTALALAAVISSLLTFAVFYRTGWTPLSRRYLRSRPWGVLCWSALLALGSILPMQFLIEQIDLTMPAATKQLFESIMKVSWGYVALGIMVPIAEEVVFRGAIQRVLAAALGGRSRWVAIAIPALLFGIIHLNVAQGAHAFVVGLLLGWMYYRTGSILPGIVFHWVNNSIAYLMFNLLPEMNDGKLIDLFHGDSRMMYGGLFFSLCIFVPALLQLAMRMRKG